MTDKEFLDYVLAHSRTERAGFTKCQYERLMKLAGIPTSDRLSPYHVMSPTAIVRIGHSVAEGLVQRARGEA